MDCSGTGRLSEATDEQHRGHQPVIGLRRGRQGGWENLGTPPVDGVDLADALAARARWPYGMLTWLMDQAPEVLPNVACEDRAAPGAARRQGTRCPGWLTPTCSGLRSATASRWSCLYDQSWRASTPPRPTALAGHFARPGAGTGQRTVAAATAAAEAPASIRARRHGTAQHHQPRSRASSPPGSGRW